MRLELGSRDVDLTCRALVVGVLDPADLGTLLRLGERHVADGADLLEVAGAGGGSIAPVVAALRDRFAVPIAVRTSSAEVAGEAFAAGAVLGEDSVGVPDPAWLKEAAGAGASIAVGGPGHSCDDLVELARQAEAAGIGASRIVVEVGLDLLRRSTRPAALGYPLLLDAGGPPETALAAAAFGVTRGCRVVRTYDVRGARRAGDVIEAILAARP